MPNGHNGQRKGADGAPADHFTHSHRHIENNELTLDTIAESLLRIFVRMEKLDASLGHLKPRITDLENLSRAHFLAAASGSHAGADSRDRCVDNINRERHIRGVTPRAQPIIPTRRKEPFDDPEWLFDFKYDGFRGLCYVEQGRCRVISRNGNKLSRFDALADQVGRLLPVDEAIIDGEVIAADESGRPQFYELLTCSL